MSPSQLAVEGHIYQGVHKASAGYKLLASMGWKEGEGLGAKGQGIVEHIKVKKKTDSLGVGTEKAMKKNEDWLLNMSVFDKMLAGLKEVKASDGGSLGKPEHVQPEIVEGKKAKNKRKASKSDVEGLSTKGSDKKREKKKKVKKAHDGEDPEGRQAAQEPPTQKKTVSHVGRFRRREAAKCVKSYSSVDLAAILGVSPQEAKESMKVEEISSGVQEPPESAEDDESESEDESSKWWAQKFVRAGTLQKPKKTVSATTAALHQRQKAAINIHGFSEEDQTNLWTRAQEGAAKGRKGLGDAAVTKVGGEKVGQGKKTVFSDPEDCGDGGTASDTVDQLQQGCISVTSGRQDCGGVDKDGTIVRKSPKETKGKSFKGKKKAGKAGHGVSKEAGREDVNRRMLKMALKKLKVNGGQLKFRKLCKLVFAGLESGKAGGQACLEQFKVVLGKSGKVEFDGKLVKRS